MEKSVEDMKEDEAARAREGHYKYIYIRRKKPPPPRQLSNVIAARLDSGRD